MSSETLQTSCIEVSNLPLSLEQFREVLFGNGKVELSAEALENVEACYGFLQRFAEGKVIYGINTGFGSMAQHKINDADQRQLQLNLIRSHCSGSGETLEPVYVKSIMLVRLATLMLGYSGIHPDAVKLLAEMVNHEICPEIFEHGSVGASGDLVQLAHLGLSLIGEGKVKFNGVVCETSEAFAKAGISPLEIHGREGLAVMNGTAAMTGIGLVNLIHAKNLTNWVLTASVMINEIVESYDDHFSEELNAVKHHKGQQTVAAIMRQLAGNSKRIRRREEWLYNGKSEEAIKKSKVQEYYSVRCVPQIAGPILDTLGNIERVLLEEVNSVNDNPVIDRKNNNVFHGGNFHGDYIALEMDKLKLVMTKLTILAERQLNFLLNDKLNNILPPYVNLGTLGLNFGMQGLQFTATSTTAENQTLANPMYVHSIPNNNDNQDVVSMGANASMLAKKVIENGFQVVAIELVAIIQAIDFLKCQNDLSENSQRIYTQLREIVPVFSDDLPQYTVLSKVKEHLQNHQLNLV